MPGLGVPPRRVQEYHDAYPLEGHLPVLQPDLWAQSPERHLYLRHVPRTIDLGIDGGTCGLMPVTAMVGRNGQSDLLMPPETCVQPSTAGTVPETPPAAPAMPPLDR